MFAVPPTSTPVYPLPFQVTRMAEPGEVFKLKTAVWGSGSKVGGTATSRSTSAGSSSQGALAVPPGLEEQMSPHGFGALAAAVGRAALPADFFNDDDFDCSVSPVCPSIGPGPSIPPPPTLPPNLACATAGPLVPHPTPPLPPALAPFAKAVEAPSAPPTGLITVHPVLDLAPSNIARGGVKLSASLMPPQPPHLPPPNAALPALSTTPQVYNLAPPHVACSAIKTGMPSIPPPPPSPPPDVGPSVVAQKLLDGPPALDAADGEPSLAVHKFLDPEFDVTGWLCI